jgi:pimeloyl-ACP methyl ester carboxylesterase
MTTQDPDPILLRERWTESFDLTRLHYTISGDGPVDFLLCDGIGCDGFIWPYLTPYLQEIGRVIHLHMRGHGESEEPRDPQAVTMEDLVRDWSLVLDEQQEGTYQRPLFALGHSMGVQVCLELRRQHPELQWRGLVLMCGTFEHTSSHFHGTQMLERALPLLRKAADLGGNALQRVWTRMTRMPLTVHIARLTEMNADLTRKRDIERYLNHLGRMNPKTFLAMLTSATNHSARTSLSELETPMLIIGGERDHFTPAILSQEMAAMLPDSELYIVPEGTHAAPIENTIEVNQRVRRFIQKHQSEVS